MGLVSLLEQAQALSEPNAIIAEQKSSGLKAEVPGAVQGVPTLSGVGGR